MCPKKCIIALCPIMHVPEEMHHYICSILHVPDITLCPKKCIIALCSILHVPEEMHHCMCPKKCIIALCPRLHCARSLHKLKIASCSKFTGARIKTSHKYQQMSKTDTLSLLITDIPKASSSKGIIFHSLRTSCHGLRTYFMHIMFLRRHSLKASSSWPADIISWPKGLISVYHDPKVS